MQQLLKHKYWWIFLVMGFAALLYLSTTIHTKIDLTAEKRFSISPATKNLLKNLDDKVEVQVFLTGNLSSGFRKLEIATEELLSSFRDESEGKLTYSFRIPGEGLSDTLKSMLYDSLYSIGVRPFNNELNRDENEKTEQLIFPSAIVRYQNKIKVVDLMSGKSGADEESSLNYSEALLEFKFDDAIDKLTKKQFPVVAYAIGNGEPINPTVQDLITTLSNNYRTGLFDIKTGILNADTIKALVIVKPSLSFTETDKIKIDQYIMQGGKVLWFVDKLYAEFDSLLRSRSEFIAFDKNLELDDLFFKYGVRINSDLAQDLSCAKQPLVVGNSGGQPQIERIPFPYYPLLINPSGHPISRNLDHVLSIFPSSIDTVKAEGIKKTILLSTDTTSRTISSPNIVTLQSIKSESDLALYNKSYLPVAVLLEGKFKSLYANRFTQAMKDTVKNFTGVDFHSIGLKESKQIVVSDGDLVTNVITQSDGALAMGTQQFENYQFANKEFLLNCLDYLVGNADIIQTRNKDFTLRLLDKSKVKEQKTMWQIINVIVPVLLVLIFTFSLQYLRKKKYNS
ncbi:MAG: gliding motility-associated ABC transporter substrate-binding protein GldG [Chitinophagaceae bacterium]|nr:gliding motility-associated ABC transporter substrate-binding protein GldG [Chitinophagaceae bacterium]